MERRTWPLFTYPISLQVRRVGGDAVNSTFGIRPLYDDSCDQARTFGHILGREFAYERYRSGEPRQSLPLNNAADRIISIPRSLVTPSGRPLPLNDGLKAGTFPTLRSRPGLTSYSSLIVECLGRYPKKLLGREV